MRDQASRVRSCLALLNMLAVCVLLAGCQLNRGAGCPAETSGFHGKWPCANRWSTGCGPCSGFQPTVWQTWQEGSMAMRCNRGEMGIAPGQIDTSDPSLPAASRPLPETIPLPDARKSGESRTQIVPEPPRSKPLRWSDREWHLGSSPTGQGADSI